MINYTCCRLSLAMFVSQKKMCCKLHCIQGFVHHQCSSQDNKIITKQNKIIAGDELKRVVCLGKGEWSGIKLFCSHGLLF